MEAYEFTPETLLAAEPRWEAGLRRAFDFTLGCILVAILSPVLAVIAIAIKLDSPGPALFRQARIGFRRREFTVFKFRSMSAGADPTRHREYVTALIEGAEETDEKRGELYKLTVDSRITSVGRWIRRWSLDELPQLFNVVKGEMSLVGPRPAIAYEVEQYPHWYMGRFDVKPGLTGLWQVNGRNERTYEEMVKLDVEYARERDLWLDIKILAKTPVTVLTGRGAS